MYLSMYACKYQGLYVSYKYHLWEQVARRYHVDTASYHVSFSLVVFVDGLQTTIINNTSHVPGKYQGWALMCKQMNTLDRWTFYLDRDVCVLAYL